MVLAGLRLQLLVYGSRCRGDLCCGGRSRVTKFAMLEPRESVSQFQQVLLRPKFIFDSASDLVLSLIGTIIDIFISICQYFISIWSVFVNFIK